MSNTKTIKKAKKVSVDNLLFDHGYFAYAAGRGGQYSLHRICGGGHVGTFPTKKAAASHAMSLPKYIPSNQ
jgi:hypothetical protein